jgi:hypothetical protein
MPPDEGDYYFTLLAKIDGLEHELAAAIKQRDEARELYCVEAAHRSVCLRSVIDARTIARVRGWDCFKEWGGA